MATLYNLGGMSTATTGTGTITLGSALYGHLTFAQAGVADGETVTYAIKDGANSEIGRGVYTSSGTTLTRTVLKSTNSNSAINLSGTAEVLITPAAEDFTDAAPNIVINGDFNINQRAFAGGSLAAAAYGFDRWKGGAAGATVSVSGDTVSLAGQIIQVIEPPALGHVSLASRQITVSVEDPSADLQITCGSIFQTITPGSGRRSITGTLGAGETGNITLYVNPASGTVTFKRLKVELGPVATAWQARPAPVEKLLCQRYYYTTYNAGVAPGSASQFAGAFFIATPTTHNYHSMGSLKLPTHMRANPTITIYAAGGGTAGQISADAGEVPGVATNIGQSGCGIYVDNTSVGTSVFLSCHVTASAEL